MTTETTDPSRTSRPYGVAALRVGIAASAIAGVLVAALGLALGGGDALLGALAGAGLALFVLTAGFVVVDLVAGLMPSASMVVALLTYTLQLVALGALLVVLQRSGELGESLSPRWLGAGVVAVALVWTVGLLVHATRARVPLFDLPPGQAEGSDR